MYIEPNSTVILLHGVPLDNRYEHTICWDDYTTAAGKEAQYNYFNNPARRLQILTKQTYQRYDRSYIKVAIPVDNLYDCIFKFVKHHIYIDSINDFAGVKVNPIRLVFTKLCVG